MPSRRIATRRWEGKADAAPRIGGRRRGQGRGEGEESVLYASAEEGPGGAEDPGPGPSADIGPVADRCPGHHGGQRRHDRGRRPQGRRPRRRRRRRARRRGEDVPSGLSSAAQPAATGQQTVPSFLRLALGRERRARALAAPGPQPRGSRRPHPAVRIPERRVPSRLGRTSPPAHRRGGPTSRPCDCAQRDSATDSASAPALAPAPPPSRTPVVVRGRRRGGVPPSPEGQLRGGREDGVDSVHDRRRRALRHNRRPVCLVRLRDDDRCPLGGRRTLPFRRRSRHRGEFD
mmetsp:Transcript_19333/g.56461  ORF Transcript_19333/g.56461 Transcript_19333/m.56461 type:complete len:289 (+) Transcript_19333:1068-1934(+)